MPATVRIRKGLDIPVAGVPEQSVSPGPPIRQVALNGQDFLGLKPRLAVAVGDHVALGTALFRDRRDAAIAFTAPGSGVVAQINRGARRALETVVIELDGAETAAADYPIIEPAGLPGVDPQTLRENLLASGLWTCFRTRPFSRVPASDSQPRSVFITAIDTQPLCPDPNVVIAASPEAFQAGVLAVHRLTETSVHVCTAPGFSHALPDREDIRHAVFDGPHPAGLPGTHIHFLDPVGPDRTVWHIDYQAVMAIGEWLLTGRIPTGRTVALGGQLVRRPRLVRTRAGASLADLLAGELDATRPRRIISGSVLSGRNVAGTNAYLGHFHHQVSVIEEGAERRLLGWNPLARRAFSAAGTWAKASGHRRRYAFTTARHGRFSGMLPIREFERLMPLDILPAPLFRALLVKDTDLAQELGALELAEEDLALCTFACPAKTDYGGALRLNLDYIERHG